MKALNEIIQNLSKVEAKENFQQLIESVEESQVEILESIENYSNDMEEVDDLLYNNSIEEIAEMLSLTIIVETYRYGLRDMY